MTTQQSAKLSRLTEEQSLAERDAGYALASDIVKRHALEVEQIVGALIEKRRIDGWP